MMLTKTILAEPDPDTQQDFLDVLLTDREWLEKEFAAIMNASGFGDRLVVGTNFALPNRDIVASVSDGICRVQSAAWLHTDMSGLRVRSPPGP